jgi:hypothetical protein
MAKTYKSSKLKKEMMRVRMEKKICKGIKMRILNFTMTSTMHIEKYVRKIVD